jgi:hypothetical protein
MPTHEDYARASPTRRSTNRTFGWVFTAAFLVIALWPLLVHAPVRRPALVVSAICLALTVLAPGLLSLPNRLWQKVGELLHRLVSPLTLFFLFGAIVTPLGVVMRVFAKSTARWRRDGHAATYWVTRAPPGPDPDSLRNQF